MDKLQILSESLWPACRPHPIWSGRRWIISPLIWAC